MMTQPDQLPKRLIQTVAELSQAVVVMTKLAAKLLDTVYGVSGSEGEYHSARCAGHSL